MVKSAHIAAAMLAAVLAGAAAAQSTVAWKDLPLEERRILAPLVTQWDSIDGARQQKWREVATRYHTMSPDEQDRLRERMSNWSNLSQRERSAARQRFQDASQLPPAERQARWEAYQALSEQQRQELAARAAAQLQSQPPGARALPPGQAARPAAPIVRPGEPGWVQAGPGASTRPISQLPAPPRHQQAGLPKIAATPEFVDSATLLPQRGPQGAAIERRQNNDKRDEKKR
jgi:hypothetical protein